MNDDNPGCSSWYIVDEAECDNKDLEEEFENIFDQSDEGSDISQLIDDAAEQPQGNSLQLFQEQQAAECDLQLAHLKRKYLSSSADEIACNLSPRLAKVVISPVKEKKKVKKSLFAEDSGIVCSHEASCSAERPSLEVQVQVHADETADINNIPASGESETTRKREIQKASQESKGRENAKARVESDIDTDCSGGSEDETDRAAPRSPQEGDVDPDYEELQWVLKEPPLTVDRILKTAHRSIEIHRALLLKTFKRCTGMPLYELCREFKSDKTCSDNWVVLLFGPEENTKEAAIISLKGHCSFYYVKSLYHFIIMLIQFKTGKCRDTVRKLFKSIMNIREPQLLANPPKTRSMTCAMYWYQRIMGKYGDTYGQLPVWIHTQTLLNHTASVVKPFELSDMVQWALDNKYTDESEIALEYAMLAPEDTNAQAFLKSNCQPRHVKDCATMVRLYLRAQMNKMSMSEFIYDRCSEVPGENDPQKWREVVKFLRYEGIEFIPFMVALKYFLKRIPKKQCLVFCGESNTGKSYFATSLVTFLNGRVISYINSSSHFWLSPLGDAKIGLLDDATHACWRYLDANMRNAFDGNPFSLDCKHKNLMQVRLPPLLITTNTDITKDDEFKYLCTRLRVFHFKRVFPCDAKGASIYDLGPQSWRSFFQRFWEELELEPQEDHDADDGERTERTLKLYTRSDS